MPEAITALLPLVQTIGAGTGLVGNIIGGVQRGQEVDALRQQQKIASNPALVSKEVAAATQPLDQGLVQAVGNQVQGTEAERGLATSPGISSAMFAQALAPYYQQNQQLALNQVLTQLGLPAEYGRVLLGGGYGGGANMTPALAALMKQFQQPTAPKPNPQIPTDYSGGGGLGDYGGYPDMGGFGGGADIPFSGYGSPSF